MEASKAAEAGRQKKMRSFLIRDILSGPASGGPESEASGPGQRQTSPEGFDCATAQSLAATQARFLAKLAEHQQQVQASKYYEQLQHQHQQLLNLNLSHQHHLQLQQQLIGSGGPNTEHSGNVASGGGSSKSSAPSASSNKRLKTSTFAYDCASPISSISDVERADEEEEDDEEEEEEEEDEDEEEEDDGGGRNRASRVEDDGQDEEEGEDEEEIEVEKLAGEDVEGSAARIARRKQRAQAARLDGGPNSEERGDFSDELCATEGSTRMNPQQQQQQQQQQQLLGNGKQLPGAPFQLNSPLDALFQMTSSTFDALKRGEKRKGKFRRLEEFLRAPIRRDICTSAGRVARAHTYALHNARALAQLVAASSRFCERPL